jgi:hypothetical protein
MLASHLLVMALLSSEGHGWLCAYFASISAVCLPPMQMVI